MFNTKKLASHTTAEVINGTLILSCPDAVEPLVWQMNLNDVSASSIAVVEDKKGDAFSLVFNDAQNSDAKASTKSVQQKIATYPDREMALAALMTITHAFKHATASINYAAMPAGYPAPRGKGGAIKWVVGTILVLIAMFFALSYISAMVRQSPSLIQGGNISAYQEPNNPQAGAQQPQSQPSQQTGVPMSADDFLNGY